MVDFRSWLDETHSSGFELRRHFFLQFFESEFISAPGQAKLMAGGVLAVLISVSLIYVQAYYHKYLVLDQLPDPGPYRLAVLADMLLVVTLVGVVGAIFTTLQWPALFPGLRDYLALAALPTRARDIFAAKFTALLAFTGAATAAIAVLPSALLPMVMYGRYSEHMTRQVPALLVSSSMASLFVFFSLVAFQGLLLNVLTPRAFARVSLAIQAFFLTVLLCAAPLVLMIPDLQPWMTLRPSWAVLVPPLWFLGLEQVVGGNPEPLAVALAKCGLLGTLAAALAAVAAYSWSYRKHRMRVLESPAVESTSSKRWLEPVADRFLPDVRALAIFAFTWKTLGRSRQHRLILTGFAGAALALILEGFVSQILHGGISTRSLQFREAVIGAPLALSLCALVGLRYLFRLPVELRANWIFRIHAPGHAAQMLAGAERFLLCFGALPVAAATLPAELRALGPAAGAAASLLCFLVSLVLMQVLLFSFEKLPFTSSYIPGRQMLILPVLRYTAIASLYIGVTGSIVNWAIQSRWTAIGLALGLSAALWKARASRLASQRIERLEFAEALEPAVRRLEIDGD
jgi:hypothetical protein